jgi:GxxExxY protein
VNPIQGDDSSLIHGDVTSAIVRVFYRVYDHLGFGFLESVYCGAMSHEFAVEGIGFVREAPIDVMYKRSRVGHFKADFLVEGRVVVEVKASEHLAPAHRRQLLNCLSASELEVGLLLHFGPNARFERVVHSVSRKRA